MKNPDEEEDKRKSDSTSSSQPRKRLRKEGGQKMISEYKKRDPQSSSMEQNCCTECDKVFASPKALFGHMRCHPDRHWRGMRPPPQHNNCLQNFNPEAAGPSTPAHNANSDEEEVASALLMLGNRRRFECSSCKKLFSSHQALGGHRASHKNVKGCFAIAQDDSHAKEEEETIPNVPCNPSSSSRYPNIDLNLSPDDEDETLDLNFRL